MPGKLHIILPSCSSDTTLLPATTELQSRHFNASPTMSQQGHFGPLDILKLICNIDLVSTSVQRIVWQPAPSPKAVPIAIAL